jgi:hypothetical protein
MRTKIKHQKAVTRIMQPVRPRHHIPTTTRHTMRQNKSPLRIRRRPVPRTQRNMIQSLKRHTLSPGRCVPNTSPHRSKCKTGHRDAAQCRKTHNPRSGCKSERQNQVYAPMRNPARNRLTTN